MKKPSLRLSLAAIAALSLSVAGCSKKSEPVSAPTPAPAAPAPTAADPMKAAADAAQAKLAAAKTEAQELEAKAAATAKADAAKLQALADKKAAEAKKTASDLKAKAATSSANLMNKASAFSASTSAPASTSPDTNAQNATLASLAQNLNPANFSSWYDKASPESSSIISSLATKAAELGSSASPEFKSLYESTLLQKKNFEDISAKLKTGGLTQWAEYYPALQSSWSDLSKSLVTAKSLLARYSK